MEVISLQPFGSIICSDFAQILFASAILPAVSYQSCSTDAAVSMLQFLRLPPLRSAQQPGTSATGFFRACT